MESVDWRRNGFPWFLGAADLLYSWEVEIDDYEKCCGVHFVLAVLIGRWGFLVNRPPENQQKADLCEKCCQPQKTPVAFASS